MDAKISFDVKQVAGSHNPNTSPEAAEQIAGNVELEVSYAAT